MQWAPFRKMSTFNFGPSNRIVGYLHKCIAAKKAGYFRPKSKTFASFDSIVYEPGKPLTNIQVTQNREHPINPCGPTLLQALLRPSETGLKPLCPLVSKPWILLFVVPEPMQTTYKKQNFKPDAAVWRGKMKQYVLGLNEYDVFHCTSQGSQ